MPVITLLSGTFCNKETIIKDVITNTGYRLIRDEDIVKKASKLSGSSERTIRHAYSAKTSIFNKFTHEKEHSIAHLKLAVAEELLPGNILIAGFSGQLVPRSLRRVLRVCIIADMNFRKRVAAKMKDISLNEAVKIIHICTAQEGGNRGV